MPARPNPAADLARMYRERIPTAPLSNYDKIIQSRLAPHRFTGGSSGLGFLRPVSNFLKTAVESLDPRFIASEGGRSVEHVYGDARELAKSVVTGEDTLSQSPSAQAYQAAGGGLGGALAAALPYVNVATAVVPTTKLLTPAGRVALAADAAERVASRQLGQAIGRATPTVRQATADATERLAQSMAAPTLADRPTIYMNTNIYDPTPPAPASASIGINEIDDILRDIRASRPEAPPTQLAGAVQPSTTNLPRGTYAVDDASGNVTIYQLDNQGAVRGKLVMNRDMDGYTVSSLSAEPGSVAAANLLAAAKITGDLNFPGVQYPLRPSTNLSQYSRPLVQKLQAAGLIDPNYVLPNAGLLNSISRPFELDMPIPVQDIPRLVGVPPEQLRGTTRDLIQALARAKQEGRISPDTIERTAQLRADLAQRQALLASQGNTFPAVDVNPPPAPTAERIAEVMGDSRYARRYMDQFTNNPVSREIRHLQQVSNIEELILTPIEQFTSSPETFGDNLNRLIANLAFRLEQHPQLRRIYGTTGTDEDVFRDEAIYETLYEIWNLYGAPREMVDSLPMPDSPL